MCNFVKKHQGKIVGGVGLGILGTAGGFFAKKFLLEKLTDKKEE